MTHEFRNVLIMTLISVYMATTYFAKINAQLSTAEQSIAKDRIFRLSEFRNSKKVASPPKLGFIGTIFHLILEQVNDTKSAYNQISDLVNGQFVDDNVITAEPEVINGTTETPKISRQEFLQILDRNLKGLARLRSLEWREARKDSWKNLQGYKDELVGGRKRNRR